MNSFKFITVSSFPSVSFSAQISTNLTLVNFFVLKQMNANNVKISKLYHKINHRPCYAYYSFRPISLLTFYFELSAW